MHTLKNFLVNALVTVLAKLLRDHDVRWVVNPFEELGVRIGTRNFFLHKGESLSYGSEVAEYRRVGKREFGEVCKSPLWRNPETGDVYRDDTKRYVDTTDFPQEWHGRDDQDDVPPAFVLAVSDSADDRLGR